MKKKPSFNFRVQWHLFEENTSTREALDDFASGVTKTWAKFLRDTWPPECKKIIRRLKGSNMGIDFWRSRAKAACRRLFGYSYPRE
jgi:hypothetical protein